MELIPLNFQPSSGGVSVEEFQYTDAGSNETKIGVLKLYHDRRLTLKEKFNPIYSMQRAVVEHETPRGVWQKGETTLSDSFLETRISDILYSVPAASETSITPGPESGVGKIAVQLRTFKAGASLCASAIPVSVRKQDELMRATPPSREALR